MVNVPEALEIDKILEYSGFDDSAQRTIITAYGFESYDYILTPGGIYIVNLAKGFSEKNVAAGKIIFALRRTNLLKATIHWAQEFRRISRTPSLIGINNPSKLRAVIEAARQRSRIRKHSLEGSDSLSKAVDSGELKRHKDWITCSRTLKNYLSTILGRYGVPLIYVMR